MGIGFPRLFAVLHRSKIAPFSRVKKNLVNAYLFGRNWINFLPPPLELGSWSKQAASTHSSLTPHDPPNTPCTCYIVILRVVDRHLDILIQTVKGHG